MPYGDLLTFPFLKTPTICDLKLVKNYAFSKSQFLNTNTFL